MRPLVGMNYLVVLAVVLGQVSVASAPLAKGQPQDISRGTPAVSNAAPASRLTSSVARTIAEAPDVVGVDLSPDGAWIVFGVQSGSVTTNRSSTRWYLRKSHNGGSTRHPFLRELPLSAHSIRWCAQGGCLSMFVRLPSNRGHDVFVLYDISSGILSRPLWKSPISPEASDDYEWSPNGMFIAFVAETPRSGRESGLDPRRGITFSQWNPLSDDPDFARHSLFLWSLLSGNVENITPPSLNVATGQHNGYRSFSWSPDGKSLAVTVDNEPNSQRTNTDLIVVRLANHRICKLVSRSGRDASPVWSHDGRWIAFVTDNGVPRYLYGWPAIVSADGGPITELRSNETPPTYSIARWTVDGRGIIYNAQIGLTAKNFFVDVTSHRVTELPDPAGDSVLHYDHLLSFDRSGRKLAFARSTPTSPSEVFVTDVDLHGHPSGTTLRLTSLASGFPLNNLVTADIVHWPSSDGRFTIHGLLLLPKWFRQSTISPRLPTILYLTGGPAMIASGFGLDGEGDLRLALAASGFAVLVPNSRGRNGYGVEFLDGIRSSGSYLRMPYLDSVSGIDFLVKRGLADPSQLGVIGHSYGGALTAFAIEQTNRFRGAVIYEAHIVDLVKFIYPIQSNTWGALLARDVYGVRNAMEPTVKARLLSESPGLHWEKIRTPTLLLFGAKQGACSVGRPLFALLRGAHVPSAAFIYDEGHVFVRPAALADSQIRTIEWLDHWVRGLPYPDVDRATQYAPQGDIPSRCED